ncbi:MAG: glycerol kinase GlpK [Saprospiraceae bacterium]|nr:glycerol kinase GlpK [Saprospiraceae bacterium]
MYILSIDQGTTSTRTIAFDRAGRIVAQAQETIHQHFPQPGWVEHDPEEILRSVRATLQQVLNTIGSRQVAAIGITNQRETTVLWDRRDGRPVYRAIVWQSRQSAAICEQLKGEGLAGDVRAKTGLLIDAYFSGTKIRWILDQVPGAQALADAGHLLFGTIDTWLLWNLTQEQVHATDFSNASRTMLFNIHRLDWDEDLCRALQVPRAVLPDVRDSSGVFGTLRADLAGGAAIPITGCAGDQQAALFGQACFRPGMVKNTYGTGCFMLMNTGTTAHQSEFGLLTTIAWGLNGRVAYALEGAVFVAGSAVKWMRDTVEWVGEAAETEHYAMSLPSSEGVYMVPAFVGLGTPYWDTDVRGAIFGLTRGSTRAHLIRATLESVAFQVRDVLDAMSADAKLTIPALRVDGGMVQNSFLMQFQSDLLRTRVERSSVQETTALGAAYLAGLATGYWEDQDDVARNAGVDRVFTPEMPREETEQLYAGWKRAVAAARRF